MLSITLHGKLIIKGEIEAVTGLHIGGAASGLDIGGIDNPIIRHPVSREPYIPGSSLRGKMRSLLDRQSGNEANQVIRQQEPQVRIHECNKEAEYANCHVCQIFGITPGDKRKGWTSIKPTRLLVRDVLMCKDPEKNPLLKAKTDLPFTEVKWEATIDRITSAAVPRQNERVPPGALFSPFELVYSLYDLNGEGVKNDIEWLKHVFKAMELLEDDYLGGYGSRGAGKIAFKNVEVVYKSRGYYQGSESNPQTLDVGSSVRELGQKDFSPQISAAIAGEAR
jgi:CRISPR-associated protein Csm3